MNMSYCRFENTDLHLKDCEAALNDLFDGDAPLSADELRAAKRLAQTCLSIIETFTYHAQKPADELTIKDVDLELDHAQREAEHRESRREEIEREEETS